MELVPLGAKGERDVTARSAVRHGHAPLKRPGSTSSPHAPSPLFRWFPRLLGVLLLGYMFFGKPFSYLVRIPGTPLFGGELVLLVGVVEAVRARGRIRSLLRASLALRAILAFMIFCALRLFWDIPAYGVTALRDSSIWYYGTYAFLVAAVVESDPTFTARALHWFRRVLPWFLVWVPLAIMLARAQSLGAVRVPGADVSINAFKGSDLAFLVATVPPLLWTGLGNGARSQRSHKMIILAAGFALLALFSQSRTSFLVTITTCTTALAFLPRRKRRRIVLLSVGFAIACLLPLLLFNPKIGVGGRELSLGQTRDNIESIFRSKAKSNEAATALQGTAEWRKRYFETVIRDSLTWEHILTHRGFGPILSNVYLKDWELSPDTAPLRSAHNSHITLLARVGVVGFGLWVVIWLTWFVEVGRLARLSRRRHSYYPARLAVWLTAAVAGILVTAASDPTLETPQGAIWLWSLVGMATAQVAIVRARPAASSRVHGSGG